MRHICGGNFEQARVARVHRLLRSNNSCPQAQRAVRYWRISSNFQEFGRVSLVEAALRQFFHVDAAVYAGVRKKPEGVRSNLTALSTRFICYAFRSVGPVSRTLDKGSWRGHKKDQTIDAQEDSSRMLQATSHKEHQRSLDPYHQKRAHSKRNFYYRRRVKTLWSCHDERSLAQRC